MFRNTPSSSRSPAPPAWSRPGSAPSPWIGLAAGLFIFGATGVKAETLASLPAAGCGFAACVRAPGAVVEGAASRPVVRLILTADRSAPLRVEGAGPGAGPQNPFTLVGNRVGLHQAGAVEVREGQVWLVAAPVAETGFAALQEEASSVASR